MPIVDFMDVLPPGPKTPAVWQLHYYSLWPLPFLEGCARRFGTPFTIRIAGYGTLVMLTAADAVKDVFRGLRSAGSATATSMGAASS